MAKKFTVIPQNTFDGLQLDAGVLLNRFDPSNPVAPQDADIICATTGGITINCTPSYSDLGSDVDNCPNNMKELKQLDSWECKITATSLGTSAESIRLALGAADITAATGAIVPRRDLEQTDFADIWWVGDKANGGLVAVQLKNALATAGFSLKTTKNGKGQVSIELTGHVSIDAQDVMPMVFYSIDETPDTWEVTQTLSHVTSTFTGHTVEKDGEFEATLAAAEGYEIASVIVTMGGEDITSEAYTSGTGVVAIASVDGDVVIVATATETT